MSVRSRVALTGATGFIGSRIAKALVELGAAVAALTRDPRPTLPAGVTTIATDLESGDGLPAALAGCDVLIHAASYVGSDEDTQHRVNVLGTERLLAAARSVGVSRILYLSTAGVYGAALADGGDEAHMRPSPSSTLSRSRYEAERRVSDAGGTIVRPNMVVGAGDSWFVLPVAKLLLELDSWIEEGRAQVSVINVASLGRATARLALARHEAGVYHAANIEPVAVRDLVEPVLVAAGYEIPTQALSLDEARRLLVPRGVSENQLGVIARNNTLDARRLWEVVPQEIPEPVLLPHDVAWYAASL